MKAQANDRLTYMPDMVGCLNKVQDLGYIDQYQAKGSHLYNLDNNRIYYPADVIVNNYYRFEGPSNPDDMAILYAIETSDGRKGTLIDAYGYYACDEVGDFMIAVTDMNKRMPGENWKHVVDVQ